MEMVVAGYETFLVDSLKLSPRLVAKQLSRCAQKVFEKESASDVDMFGRQVSYSLSFVRMRMKAVTTGKTTHLAIKRICECLQKMGYADDFHQEDRSSPRLKRVHSPDRSAGSLHMWTGCAGIHCTASLCKRHRSQTSPGPPKLAKFEVSVFRSSLRLRLIFAMYGLASKNAEEQASSKKAPASPPISIGSSSSSKVAWCQWSRQRPGARMMRVPSPCNTFARPPASTSLRWQMALQRVILCLQELMDLSRPSLREAEDYGCSQLVPADFRSCSSRWR